MIQHKKIKSVHGGDIYRNHVKLDFSVNINPMGVPTGVKEALLQGMDQLEHYPDPLCSELVHAIAQRQQIREEYILCGNGASEIFQMLVHAIKPQKAQVMAPTFSGYEYVLSQVGSAVQYYGLQEKNEFRMEQDFLDTLTPDLDLVFVSNPNNPIGSCVEPYRMCLIAEKCRENQIYLAVDECFLEFTGQYEQQSMKQYLQEFPNMIVVNAFTKTYAIPGIRLGYGMCSDEKLLKKMRRKQPEWSVSVPAQISGVAAIREQDYMEKSRMILETERKFLMQALLKLGIYVFPSDSNFLFWKAWPGMSEKLLQDGILIRECSNYKGLDNQYYRSAIKKHAENVQLIQAIERNSAVNYDGN